LQGAFQCLGPSTASAGPLVTTPSDLYVGEAGRSCWLCIGLSQRQRADSDVQANFLNVRNTATVAGQTLAARLNAGGCASSTYSCISSTTPAVGVPVGVSTAADLYLAGNLEANEVDFRGTVVGTSATAPNALVSGGVLIGGTWSLAEGPFFFDEALYFSTPTAATTVSFLDQVGAFRFVWVRTVH
jgi:hypothetical protein